jgi:hypothetical protein
VFHHRYREATFIGAHPKDNIVTPELTECIRGKNIVLVDIAWSKDVMVLLASVARKVIVLDHHVTNEQALASLVLPNLRGIYDMNMAGVWLAWDFVAPLTPMPKPLYYIGLKDIWKHEDDQDALHFLAAFQRPATWAEWSNIIEDTYGGTHHLHVPAIGTQDHARKDRVPDMEKPLCGRAQHFISLDQ